jgi:sulfur relay (sulfurtransferase) DsrF/TusC family protein
MNGVAIILRKPPYGEIHAAEALRHALGGAGRVNICLLLVDAGVLLAATEQKEGDTGLINLGKTLKDCMEKSIEVYADRTSIEEQNLKDSDILDGVKVVSEKEISEMIKNVKAVMVF